MKINIKLTLIFLVCLLFMFLNPYKIIVVKGQSMYPTYKDGQVIFAKKFSSINKGDIVIARNDLGEIIIKRVKYVPGDYYYHYLTRMEDGTSEIYFLDNSYKLISTFKDNNKDVLLIENKVPLKQYFLMGDNVDNSDDSRRFGSVSSSDILYKVVK